MYQLFTFQKAFITIVFLAACVFGQGETTPVDRSSLAGVRFPAGAQRVNEAHVPAEIAQALDKLVAQGEGKLRKGSSEVVVWTDDDLKNTGAKSIVDRLSGSLRTDGWKYEVAGNDNGITLFTALKDGQDRRAIMGIHGESNGTFVLAWAEVHAANAAPANAAAIDTSSGNVADYNLATPAGWSRSDSTGKITLTKGDTSVMLLPPVESSGNLERDADRIIWQVYKGYGPWSGNGFEPDWGIFERGRTGQGLEYFRAYRYAIRNGDDSMFGESRFDAVILLVKLGSKVAVIAGRSPFQSDYSDDSAVHVIDRILYDIKFKSSADSYDLKRELLGSWSAASGSVGLAYTFNANGSFNKGAAHQFRVGHDATRDKVTTTSWAMTETYSLAGNLLTQNYKRTGEVMKYKIRIYETKYNKDPWQQKLGFLPVADATRGTIVLKKDI